jgi:hypothetical protein
MAADVRSGRVLLLLALFSFLSPCFAFYVPGECCQQMRP